MYIKLIDGDEPAHSAKVEYRDYGDMNNVRRQYWQKWNIPFTDFDDMNLANVKTFTIGFGDGNQAAGNGTVFFEDITLTDGNYIANDPYDEGSIQLFDDPFVFGIWGLFFEGYLPVIDQHCVLIDRGYGYIDWYPELIGKTDSVDWTPDSGIVDIGWHYYDPYYVNAGETSIKADFDNTGVVDFNDLELFADKWLGNYQEDYNNWFVDFYKYDLNNDGIIDFLDFAFLANDWLQTSTGYPPIELTIGGDANTGFVEIGATGYFPDTQRIFVLVDGQYAGEIFGFKHGDILGIDVSKLADGEHQLKAIGIDSNCLVTCTNVTNVDFGCPLNYCFLPEHYEPNKPLYFSAFNSSAEDVTVNVYADCGNLVWSQNYSGDSFFDSIPAGITNEHVIDYVSFDIGGGGMLKAGGGELLLLDAGGGASIVKTSYIPPADPTKPPYDIQALIILPDYFLNGIRVMEIMAVRKAFITRGINLQTLGPLSATYDKVKQYAKYHPIKYIYILAHGEYRINGFLRTLVFLHYGPVVSMKKSDFTNPNEAPSWCVSLNKRPDELWEEMTPSFYSMGFSNLEFVYFDSCYVGRLTINEHNQLVEGQPGQFVEFPFEEDLCSDMSIALGLNMGLLYGNRAYHGWYEEIPAFEPFNEPATGYLQWTRDMWERLGAGDTVGEALMITMDRQTNWGDPNAPVNCFRFKGQGDIPNIQLVGN